MLMLVMKKMVTTMLVEDLDRCDVWTVWPVAPLIHRQTDLLKKIANQFFWVEYQNLLQNFMFYTMIEQATYLILLEM